MMRCFAAGTLIVFSFIGLIGSTQLSCAGEAREAAKHRAKDAQSIERGLRIARLAEQNQQYDKALDAYQRVLDIDPANVEALQGVGRLTPQVLPDRTKYTIELGGGPESNPARQTPGTGSDLLLISRFDVKDERNLMGTQWRSIAQLIGDFYASQSVYSYGYAGATTGPVYYLRPDFRVHPEVGAGTSMYGNHWFYNETVAAVSLESAYWNGVQTVRFRVGYRQYNEDEFPATNGYYFDIMGRFASENLIRRDDIGVISPWYRHSDIGGVGFTANFDAVQPGTYEEVGAKAEYFFPVIAERLVVGGHFSISWRQYAAVANLLTGVDQQRTDVTYTPGASVIFTNLFGPGCDLRFDYRYDINRSNFDIDSFDDQIATTSIVRRF